MNIDRIEQITKEIRTKEKQQVKMLEKQEKLDNEIQELHDELATIIVPNNNN